MWHADAKTVIFAIERFLSEGSGLFNVSKGACIFLHIAGYRPVKSFASLLWETCASSIFSAGVCGWVACARVCVCLRVGVCCS